MIRIGIVASVVGLLLAAAPATAQLGNGTDALMAIEALRSGNESKAIELLSAHPSIINARDRKGETLLLVAVTKRDEQWTSHLLSSGADPNLAARNGDTPLIVASRIGFETAVDWLLEEGAKVDATNRMGETALIAAVQQRRPEIVKTLLEAGADPDKADAAAGYSARDYAKRDTRAPQVLRLIEAAKPKAR